MGGSTSECSDSCSEASRYFVLPPPPEDEDITHEELRASLFNALGLEIRHTEGALLPSKAGEPQPHISQNKPCRLLRVCGCLCDCCVRVSCGAVLDALRVDAATDSELYIFQGHLHATPGSRKEVRKARNAVKCLRQAEGRESGAREEAWGLLAGCAGHSSLRSCLSKLLEPPKVLRLCRDGHIEKDFEDATAAARYAAQGRRLLSLYCSPANIERRSEPDEQKTAILHASAAELGAYIHPNVRVATFEREGRGLMAAEKLQQGDVLLRMPTDALINVYTALSHPTFSPVAQMLLGLPLEHLQHTACSASCEERQPEQIKELQPLVDCDVVVCLFLLFLAFAAGQEGGQTLLRFLPPVDAADGAATAKALYPNSPTAEAAAAAAQATEKEAHLLSDPEGVTEFLEDEALADAMNTCLAKCSMMEQQLLPLLQQAFPPPEGLKQTGVLAACRDAAAAAAREMGTELSGFCGGAVAAAAEVSARTGAPVGPPLKGRDLLCAFVGHLSYIDFLWAHAALESRSFSLRLQPKAPVKQLLLPPGQDLSGEANGEAGHNFCGDTDEPLTVPFHPGLSELSPRSMTCSVLLPVDADGCGPCARFHVKVPSRCSSLVPLGELLNHHAHGQVLEPSIEGDGQWLSLRLACDVPKGAQVYAHYGPFQSWQFLGYFGFCPASFHHLEPPEKLLPQAKQANKKALDAALEGNEWRFSGETPGNPMDFIAIQVEIASDDAEMELKRDLMQLQSLPLYGVLSTGAEVIPWEFLASLFVSSHINLDKFLAEGASEDAASPAAAAAVAGEKAWGPTYIFTALRRDQAATQNIRNIILEVLESVAEGAKRRIKQLDEWKAAGETAPQWTHAWGDRVRIYLQNQIALSARQIAAVGRSLPVSNEGSSA